MYIYIYIIGNTTLPLIRCNGDTCINLGLEKRSIANSALTIQYHRNSNSSRNNISRHYIVDRHPVKSEGRERESKEFLVS